MWHALPALVFLLLAGTPLRAADPALPRTVVERFRVAGLEPDALGVFVQRLSDHRVVLAHRADEPIPPASTLKVLTSLVALDRLGPAWRGRTEMRAAGEQQGDVLVGDLVLRGGADVDFDVRALDRMLQRLRLRGIREIRGDLVLDRTWFDPPRMDLGVPPFDESPEFRYNAIPDALLFNTNLVELEIVAGRDDVRVASTPEVDGVRFEAEFRLVDGPCDSWEDLWRYPAIERSRSDAIRVRLRGDFPRECATTTAINVIEPNRFVAGTFRAAWRRLGGTWKGRVREARAPAGAVLVAEHRSRPLGEFVRDILKRSDNPIARATFLALGAASVEPGPTTFAKADAVVRGWLAERGLDGASLVLENGSGLSRRERISPALLGGVLGVARRSSWGPEIEAGLPIVAIDGGMRNRLKKSPAAAGGRLKTGTLRDVSALAGFVRDGSGEAYIVVAMVHHPKATKQLARPLLDALVDWVARGASAED